PARQIGHPLSGKVIALLEDQRPVLESLRALFEALGAAVIAGESEVEFLAETSKLERAPDLFIMDFMIQRDVLASRCLTLLRQRFGYSNVRALILTGNPSHPELRNVFGVPVVEKPLSEQALKKIIAALLGQIPWDSSAFA
ncbi:MAG TPA: response regulator, partial [Burkholderiaceae bacterium]|nr:response regulator [Burkholderiaceae bacterium]